MDYIKSYYNIISTIFFVLAIVVAHIYSTNNYDWTKNTISDLASQGYNRKLIMQIGLLGFGLTLAFGHILNGLTWRTSPIFIYGICVALTGIFCTKPFVDVNTYCTTQSTLHSTFAQIAGVAFSIGILTQIYFTTDNNKIYSPIIFYSCYRAFCNFWSVEKLSRHCTKTFICNKFYMDNIILHTLTLLEKRP